MSQAVSSTQQSKPLSYRMMEMIDQLRMRFPDMPKDQLMRVARSKLAEEICTNEYRTPVIL